VDLSAALLSVNRDTRRVALDLRRPQCRAALMLLIEGADVLMHNIRPQKPGAKALDSVVVWERRLRPGAREASVDIEVFTRSPPTPRLRRQHRV